MGLTEISRRLPPRIRDVASGKAELKGNGWTQRLHDTSQTVTSYPVCFVAGYGLTETAPGVLLAPIGGSVRVPNGSVGILLPAMESRIVNLQTGA